MFSRDVWLGSFLNRLEILHESVPRSILPSFINGLQYESLAPFLNWAYSYEARIGEPLFSVALNNFFIVWVLGATLPHPN